jgi:hypothetical protein
LADARGVARLDVSNRLLDQPHQTDPPAFSGQGGPPCQQWARQVDNLALRAERACFQSERLATRVAKARSTAGAWQTLSQLGATVRSFRLTVCSEVLLIALSKGSARATGSLGGAKEDKLGSFTHERRQAIKFGG